MDAMSDPVRDAMRLRDLRPGVEAAQLDHLAKLVEALHGILDLGQFQADGVGLVDDLEQREADGALEEQVVDDHHGCRAGVENREER